MTSSTKADTGLKQVNTKTATLAAHGPRLLLGGAAGAPLGGEITVRPWRLREEKELGELRDSNKDANLAQFVAMVLGSMCPVIGRDLTASSPNERRAYISQMWLGDVFQAYVWLRRQAIGNEMAMTLTCQSCANKFPFVADLDTLEVTTAATLEDAQWEFKLRDPFKVRGKLAEVLVCGPARWFTIEQVAPGASMNSGAAKANAIRGSIHAIKGQDPFPLTETELDDMTKRDLETLSKSIDDNAIGPDMRLDAVCPRCKRQVKRALDWGYDSFFGNSSP